MTVETTTKNYGWTKPVITGSASTWGGFLNTDLDSIDSVVFSNQQGLVPIGSITMFAGANAPANWLICDGAPLPHQTGGAYESLFAVIGYTYGGSGANFNLPNLVTKYPLGAGPNPLGQAAGSFSNPIAVANLPAHTHPITDVAHNHGINQSPHAHPDGGHVHGASVSQDDHTHTVGGVAGPYGAGFAAGSGAQVSTGTTSGASQSGVYISIAAASSNIGAQNANISLNASGTGLSTTQPTGSGTPLSVVPPFLAINFIIRYQ